MQINTLCLCTDFLAKKNKRTSENGSCSHLFLVSSVWLPWNATFSFVQSAELLARGRSDNLMPSTPKLSQYSAAAWKTTWELKLQHKQEEFNTMDYFYLYYTQVSVFTHSKVGQWEYSVCYLPWFSPTRYQLVKGWTRDQSPGNSESGQEPQKCLRGTLKINS